MSEPKPGGIRGRVSLTFLYGMLCALEVRGYLLARAGQSVMDIPRLWQVGFGAFCVWWCWDLLETESRKSSVAYALFRLVVEGAGFCAAMRGILLGIAGKKILERPPDWQMALYVVAIVFLVALFSADTIGKRSGLAMTGRLAALMLAVLFATKIGMAFVAGHDAILLKGIGCIAVAVGTFEMLFSVLNAVNPEESEFPAIPDSLPIPVIPAPKSSTMKGKESQTQERPLGLRRLARLDQSTGKSRRTQANRRRGFA